MKALPCIDFIQTQKLGFDNIGYSISQTGIKAIDFYSQPFKPDIGGRFNAANLLLAPVRIN